MFGTVTYSIGTGNTGNAFFVDPVSGTVQLTTGMVDYEAGQSFSLQLVCRDGGNPANMDSIILPIFVTPVNEHPPVFPMTSSTVSIGESLITPSVVITDIQATDQDSAPHNQIWYTIIGGNQLQKLDISHTTAHITLIQPLDFESVNKFTLTIQADDSGGIAMPNYVVLNSTTEVVIMVVDENDHTPVFNQSTYSGTSALVSVTWWRPCTDATVLSMGREPMSYQRSKERSCRWMLIQSMCWNTGQCDIQSSDRLRR